MCSPDWHFIVGIQFSKQCLISPFIIMSVVIIIFSGTGIFLQGSPRDLKLKVGISKELEGTPTSAAAQCPGVAWPGLQGCSTMPCSGNSLDALFCDCV